MVHDLVGMDRLLVHSQIHELEAPRAETNAVCGVVDEL